jgi:hypothetical protein
MGIERRLATLERLADVAEPKARPSVDAIAFAQSLGFEPDAWQANCLRWDGKQALWNCARQSGKSTIASLLAVHRALYWPGSLILLVSPSLRQSSELFRKVGEWLNKLNDRPALNEDNKLSCTLSNGSRIVSLPSSEATIRGYSGVSLVVEDEAARVPDDLYRAVRPMLAVSGGRMILMSTPFGKRGHFFEEWTRDPRNGGQSWQRVRIAATENPRIAPEFLEEERASLGEWWFKQEYLCEFADAADSVFSFDVVMSAVSADVKPLFELGTESAKSTFADAITSDVKTLADLIGVVS